MNRRGFLKKIGLGTITVLIPSIILPTFPEEKVFKGWQCHLPTANGKIIPLTDLSFTIRGNKDK